MPVPAVALDCGSVSLPTGPVGGASAPSPPNLLSQAKEGAEGWTKASELCEGGAGERERSPDGDVRGTHGIRLLAEAKGRRQSKSRGEETNGHERPGEIVGTKGGGRRNKEGSLPHQASRARSDPLPGILLCTTPADQDSLPVARPSGPPFLRAQTRKYVRTGRTSRPPTSPLPSLRAVGREKAAPRPTTRTRAARIQSTTPVLPAKSQSRPRTPPERLSYSYPTVEYPLIIDLSASSGARGRDASRMGLPSATLAPESRSPTQRKIHREGFVCVVLLLLLLFTLRECNSVGRPS